MAETDKAEQQTTSERGPGLVPPPSAYLARARAAIGPAAPPARGVRVRRLSAEPLPTVYQAQDPAMRLIRGARLPHGPQDLLTGMVVQLSGARDGEEERLLYDLGDTQIRAFPQFAGGKLTVVFARLENAARYRSILRTLRYLNRARAPAGGERRVTVQTVDAEGALHPVADLCFLVAGASEAQTHRADSDGVQAAEIDGDTVSFSESPGAFILYWWPHRLEKTAERARETPLTASLVCASAADHPAASSRKRGEALRLADLFGSERAYPPRAGIGGGY
jgi:hypothetical protein